MTATRVRVVAPEVNVAVVGHPDLARLEAVADLVLHREPVGTRAELLRRLAGAQVMLNPRRHVRMEQEVIEHLPDLRAIVILGVGLDAVDLDAATELGVIVCNSPGVNARSVAEHTIALLLAVIRGLRPAGLALRRGEWRPQPSFEVEGKTLGVLGLGDIGRTVCRLGSALGMNVIAWSRTADPERAAGCHATLVERETLLREADAVCLCLPLTPETRNSIDAAALALMKPGAVLVNTARGALVDEAALAAALRAGRLAGAGLDVFATEPPAPDNPLLALENVVVTPHTAWSAREAWERTIRTPVDNIIAWIEGRPRNVVNPAALTHPRQRR